MRRSFWASGLLAGVFLALAGSSAEAKGRLPFRSFSLPVRGVVRNFVTADFARDGLRDVVITYVVFDEAQRKTDRFFAFYPQTAEGFSNEPAQTWEVPADAVGLDVGNFDLTTPGPELGYIASGGIFYFKFDQDRFITAPTRLLTAPTVFRALDPHSVVAMQFATDLSGDGQEEIIVADFGQTYLYAVLGEGAEKYWSLVKIFPTPLRGRVSTYWENDVLLSRIEQSSSRTEILLPQVMQGDLDGDGLTDVLAPREGTLFVYRQTAPGVFADFPLLIDFAVFPLSQFMRHGSIPEVTRLYPADFNGDGLSDVIISRLQVSDLGSAELVARFYVFLNKGGKFGERPDEEWTSEGGFIEQPLLADFNQDGRDDIAVQRFPFGVSALLRYKLFESAKVEYELYLSDAKGKHDFGNPSEERRVTFDFDLSKQSASLLVGFSLFCDFDGDRNLDLLQAKDPDGYTILLSTPKEWADEKVEVEIPSSFFTFPQDLNGDGRDDILVRYANQGDLDSQVRILLSVPSK
ncbi:MAG: VCBS repeat-containing protein [Bdellovibrionota bacterium]